MHAPAVSSDRSARRRRSFRFDRSLLVRLFGWRAALIHGDPLMLDRWLFVKRHIPRTRNGERVIDVGCGTGAFSLALAARGYRVTGLSWDSRNQAVAQERAAICALATVDFPVVDVRQLDERTDLAGQFDYALCLENIEHILDDRKLMRDVAATLRPGGWLVLSAPNHNYRAMSPADDGPFQTVEQGWHVRRGYTRAMLTELAQDAGLLVEEIGGCSGWISQKLCSLMHRLGRLGWPAILPLRIVPPLLDGAMRRLTGYPDFSITLVALKPRLPRD